MKKILVLALALVLALTLFTACGGNTDNGDSGTNTPNQQGENNNTPDDNNGGASADPESPEAAFAQFGLNYNDIKAGLGTANEITIEYGNNVNDTVFLREASYMENCETDVDEAAGNAYNQKMFDLCKAASADGKIYKNKTAADGEPDEITSIDDIIDPSVMINVITWSYKIDGMWVDVYMDWNLMGDEIGIRLGGSGKY
jgi:hypothetical protein